MASGIPERNPRQIPGMIVKELHGNKYILYGYLEELLEGSLLKSFKEFIHRSFCKKLGDKIQKMLKKTRKEFLAVF